MVGASSRPKEPPRVAPPTAAAELPAALKISPPRTSRSEAYVAPIAALVARDLPGTRVHAADLDPVPLGAARANLGPHGAVHHGDLYAALPSQLRGQVDVLAVNAPYVPSEEIALMPPEARLHEPLIALDGGPDGLDLHRRVAAGAGEWLGPGGVLLIETSVRQAPVTASICTAAGLRASVVHDDELDATAVRAVVAAGA